MAGETIEQPVEEANRNGTERNRPIERAALVLIAAGALHDLDHVFNQPRRAVHPAVAVLAALAWVAMLGTFYLAHRGHRLAPQLALLTGLGTVVGFVVVHLLPDFGFLSDSFDGLGVNALSWVLVALPMAAGLALAYVAGRQLAEGDSSAGLASSPALD